ncbi:hypothetical protein BKA63DRAFT_263650 [Paraphoma chrysanthemicola]|nr:hypothetical protein BKA63DRAFT_263650 [Paraphoma chrysanthemicola]
MSGVEVVALVAAIISAFTGTISLLKERRARKRNKTRERLEDMDRLRRAMIEAPTQIQLEYDYDFARIGPAFASGDAIAREQLASVLISMQGNMIDQLQSLLLHNSSSRGWSFASLVKIAELSRSDSIAALTQQYQRLQMAAPIARNWMGSSFEPYTRSRPTTYIQVVKLPVYTLPLSSVPQMSDPTERLCSRPSLGSNCDNTATISGPQVPKGPLTPSHHLPEAYDFPAPPPPPPPLPVPPRRATRPSPKHGEDSYEKPQPHRRLPHPENLKRTPPTVKASRREPTFVQGLAECLALLKRDLTRGSSRQATPSSASWKLAREPERVGRKPVGDRTCAS